MSRGGGVAAAALRVVLPSQLQELAGGAREVEVEAGEGTEAGTGARTVREALDVIGRAYPAVRGSIITERGEVRPHVNLFVDGEDIRWTGGLETSVDGANEILVMRAVSGG